MRPSNPITLSAALGLLLLAGATANAEPIWSYSWSSSPGVVTSNDGTLGKVTLLPGSGGPITGSVDSGNGLLASSLLASTTATSGVATFTNRGYGLTVHLTDSASHATGDLSFAGALSGTLGTVNSLTNSFQSPTTRSVTLGGNLYTVSIGLYIPPAPGTPGRIGANVVVTGSGTVTPPVNNVPEPTSLVLAGLGLSALGVRLWRRKAQAAGALASAA